MTERPLFLVLRRNSGLTSQQVAQEAGLSLADEYRAEIGSAIEAHLAERIVAAFSRLTGKTWSVAEMAISIRKDTPYGQHQQH